jgi:hypothetical protein
MATVAVCDAAGVEGECRARQTKGQDPANAAITGTITRSVFVIFIHLIVI